MRIFTLAAAGLLALAPMAASAQNYTRQPTPDPGQYVPVFAMACLDSQGRALPPGSASCVTQQTMATTGTVTANQGAPNTTSNRWPVELAPGGAANAAGNPIFAQIVGGLPAGSNVIGAVTQSGAPWSVSGTVAATQSGTWNVGLNAGTAAIGTVGVTALPSIPAGSNTIGAVNVLGGNATAVRVDGSGVTQPVSAAALPLPAGASTSANQSSEIAALGTTGDSAYTGSGAASIVAAIKGVYTATLQPLAAGSAIVGKVGIDQTTAGTTNGVVVNGSALPAGAATAAGQNVTAAGTSATNAQAIQGLFNGYPVNAALEAYYSTTLAGYPSGFNNLVQMDQRGQLKISETGSSDPLVGITPVLASSATSLVGKASAGNLYGAYAYNGSATASFLVAINATSVPAASAAITPVECVPLPASGSAAVNYGAGPPDAYATGIVLLVSTSCTTYTAGGASFIRARVR